jgi:hypothetical protein
MSKKFTIKQAHNPTECVVKFGAFDFIKMGISEIQLRITANGSKLWIESDGLLGIESSHPEIEVEFDGLEMKTELGDSLREAFRDLGFEIVRREHYKRMRAALRDIGDWPAKVRGKLDPYEPRDVEGFMGGLEVAILEEIASRGLGNADDQPQAEVTSDHATPVASTRE